MSAIDNKLRKQAANCLYCFIEDNELNARNFGRYLRYVTAKRNSQLAYIKGLAVANATNREYLLNSVIYNELKAIYGMTPKQVIVELANGNSVKGLNWSEGVYGCIGDVTDPSSFGNLIIGNVNTNRYSLDTVNGICTDTITGTQIKGTPVYGKKGLESVSFYDQANNVTLQANFKKGAYKAYSVSDGTNTLKTNGKALTQYDGEMWTNILNVLAEVKDLISGLATMLSGETAQSLSPAQVADGWYEPASSSTNSGLTTAALLGGGLLLGATILGADGKPAKKEK